MKRKENLEKNLLKNYGDPTWYSLKTDEHNLYFLTLPRKFTKGETLRGWTSMDDVGCKEYLLRKEKEMDFFQ